MHTVEQVVLGLPKYWAIGHSIFLTSGHTLILAKFQKTYISTYAKIEPLNYFFLFRHTYNISKDSFFHSHGLLACLFLHEKMLRWYQSLLCSYLVTPIIIEKLAETEIWRPRSCKLVVPRGWMTIWKKKLWDAKWLVNTVLFILVAGSPWRSIAGQQKE